MNKPPAFLFTFFAVVVLLFGATSAPANARPLVFTPTQAVTAAVVSCASGGGTASITGTVLLPGSTPAANVQVELYTLGGSRVDATTTNGSGVYTLDKLVAGTYLIRFNPEYVAGALLDEWYDNKDGQPTATPVVVADGAAVTGINATLAPGGRISGRVTASDTGNGLSGVQVLVYDANGDRVAYTTTTGTGDYTTSPGLRSGDYRIYFRTTGGTPYVSEYYADKPDLASATAVAVTVPATTTGINAALAPAARISGRVTDAVTGAGLAGFSVTISGDDGYIDSDYTDASGNYLTSAGLASGTYRLTFSSLSDTSDYIVQEKTVTVTAPNTTTGVNAAMEKGGRLTGKVTDGAGTPLQNITVFVADEFNDYQNYVYTDAAGVYTAYGLPTNNYIVYFRPSEYLEEHYNDKPDRQLANRIPVTAPTTVSGIDAVLEKGGALSGRVTAADTGAGLDDVWVEIYDVSGDRIETAYTAADGTYATKNVLPAGSYTVKFIPDDNGASCGYIAEYYNDKQSFETADPVVITPPNTTADINAVLQPGGSVSGRVTAPGGSGIDNVYVQVYDNAGERVASGFTNAAGTYVTSPALGSGTYRVGFFPRQDDLGRYLNEYYNDKPTLALSDPIVVTAPAGTSGVDAVLAQGGAISGKITAADTGLPLSNVSVYVYDATGETVAYAYANQSGAYTTSGLPSGSYRVRFDPGGNAGPYLGEYYNDAPSLAAAVPVVVTAPNLTANIDAALGKGATISGRVTAADSGNPLPNVGVTVYDSSGEEVGFASTKADGTYITSSAFTPGTYHVQFIPYGASSVYAAEFYNDKASLATASPVVVAGAAPVAGIDASLAVGARITGRVTDASSGAGIPGISIEVYDSSGSKVADGYTGPTGSYMTEPSLASGSYRVRFTPSENPQLAGYVAAYYNGKGTLDTADVVQLNAPTNTSGIDGVLAKGGQIAGQVLSAAAITRATGTVGQPDVKVTVYDAAGRAVATGETNGLGMYTTSPGLPNGSYRLGFTPPASTGYGTTFYRGKLSLAAADVVTIGGPGKVSGINDTLQPVRSLFVPYTRR